MNHRQAVSKIVKKRNDQLIVAQRLFEQALLDPEFCQAELALRAATLTGQGVDEALQRKKTVLQGMGLSMEMLDPPPTCPICADTGWAPGRVCECAVRLSCKDSTERHDIPSDVTFDTLNLDFYADERQSAEQLIRRLQGFCAKFPHNKHRSISLLGNTGTGKTVLAMCVANELAARGFGVLFCSAFGLANDLMGYHAASFELKADILAPFVDCDLLVIDDLGTETIFRNVTIEYLYLVISERLLRGKHILVTSNLLVSQLTERYGARITSRLFDKNQYFGHVFSGHDKRIIMGDPNAS